MRDVYGIAEMLGARSLDDASSAQRDGDTITYYGTATSDSDSGTVSVHLSDDVSLADGQEGTSVELPCTCAVRDGDTVMVTLVAAGNALRVPTVTGVVGSGDMTRDIAEGAQETADSVVAHFWYDDDGAHVTETEHDATVGGNVLIDTDSVDIRDGETVLARFEADRLSLLKDFDAEQAAETHATARVDMFNGGAWIEAQWVSPQWPSIGIGGRHVGVSGYEGVYLTEGRHGSTFTIDGISASSITDTEASVSWSGLGGDHTTHLTGQYLLYSGNASGNLTLSHTAADFEMIRVHYVCGNAGHSSLDVYNPNGKNFTCVGTSMANATTMQMEFAEYSVSGTSISKVNGGYFNAVGTNNTFVNSDSSAQAQIRITRVEGFEHWETTGLSAGSGGGSASYEAGTGIDITNNTISVDTAQLSYADLQDRPLYALSPVEGGNAVRTNGILYGKVDATSTATAFTATVEGVTEYYDGLAVMLENGVVTSASGFTIDVNGLGAKPAYSNMAAATRETTIFNVAYTLLFVYDSNRADGGAWVCYRGYDSNTNTIGYQLRSNSGTLPASDKGYRYRLWFTSADHTHWVPANTSTSTNATSARTPNTRPIDPFGPIIYYSTNGTTNAGANLAAAACWQQYVVALGYSFNDDGALSLTYPAPVYLKCEPLDTGGATMLGCTQTLPTRDDGCVYVLLGIAYSAANIELRIEHPVYYYNAYDGEVQMWSDNEALTNQEIEALLTGADA